MRVEVEINEKQSNLKDGQRSGPNILLKKSGGGEGHTERTDLQPKTSQDILCLWDGQSLKCDHTHCKLEWGRTAPTLSSRVRFRSSTKASMAPQFPDWTPGLTTWSHHLLAAQHKLRTPSMSAFSVTFWRACGNVYHNEQHTCTFGPSDSTG